MGLVRLLAALNIHPGTVAGHSYGEYVALCCAGVFDEETLYRLSEARGRSILDTAVDAPGAMVAVMESPEQLREHLGEPEGMWIANVNAPQQTVLSGTREAIDRATEILSRAGIATRMLPVGCAFHSPLVAPAQERLSGVLTAALFGSPGIPVYSNVLATRYPDEPDAVKTVLTEHLLRPVRFAEQIVSMYRDGVRVFLEVGPRSVLTGLVSQILQGQPHLAVATDSAEQPGLLPLLNALGRLAAHGVSVDLDRLFAERTVNRIALTSFGRNGAERTPLAISWMISGGGIRPLHDLPTAPADQIPVSVEPASLPISVSNELSSPPSAPAPSQMPVSASTHRFTGKGTDTVMLRFQGLMGRFLQTQQSVMMAFLNESEEATEPPRLPPSLLPSAEQAVEDPKTPQLPDIIAAPAPQAVVNYPDRREERRAQILESVSVKTNPPENSPRQTDTSPPLAALESELPLPRCLSIVEAAPEPPSSRVSSDGVFVITDDQRGVARVVVARLQESGAAAVLVRADGNSSRSEPNLYTANLSDPNAIRELATTIRREHGRVACLLHLLPLHTPPGEGLSDAIDDQARLAVEVKGLAHLARAFADDLRSSESACLLAATALGGTFGIDANGRAFFPGQGGIAGLIKTLALEWPSVRCRVVDLDGGDLPVALADIVLRELAAQDDLVEVGYHLGIRQTIQMRQVPLAAGPERAPLLDADSVVLITGGARGITARIAQEIARRFHPTLILLGRSAEPPPAEPSATAGFDAEREIKAALIETMRATGQAVTPREVESAYQRTLHARAIRRNLAHMREAGARVHYYQADVRDPEALATLLDTIYATHGRLDAVIHGAGVIEDRLFLDKKSDSFDRVFDTKTVGALALARHLRPDTLRFLALFSSVAGRFGNRGQSDYAAANEVLNKLALYLDTRWPGRVVAFNWGPWKSEGMVSEAVAHQFAERGVGLIPADAGVRAFLDELAHGRKGEVEVILGQGPWTDHPVAGPPQGLAAPLVDGCLREVGDAVEFVRQLNTYDDLYLHDHRLEGRPVLPAAMAAELMAEAVAVASPNMEVAEIGDFQQLRGIVLSSGPKTIRVSARPLPAAPDAARFAVSVQEEGASLPAYQGVVLLTAALPPPISSDLLTEAASWEVALEASAVYTDHLFHGPCFQCMVGSVLIRSEDCIANMVASRPADCLTYPHAARWTLDPVLLDGGPQLAIVWSRSVRNAVALPCRFRRLRRFARMEPGAVLVCHFKVDPEVEAPTVRADVSYTDAAGRVVLLVEGWEATCSQNLNRLVAQERGRQS
jgi:NAD(P)-dependent dehydrogenase (short-subunit alcohol dehydrogenase family)